MPTDDPENEHDYVGGGLRNIEIENPNIIAIRVQRFLRRAAVHQDMDTGQSSSGYAPNSDHNYINVFPFVSFSGSNEETLGTGGTVESDQDIFDAEDDEVTSATNDVNSRSPSSTTYESGEF